MKNKKLNSHNLLYGIIFIVSSIVMVIFSPLSQEFYPWYHYTAPFVIFVLGGFYIFSYLLKRNKKPNNKLDEHELLVRYPPESLITKTKALHITPGNPYEEVYVIANKISERNQLSMILDDKGKVCMTGGILVQDEPEVRKLLDQYLPQEHHNIIKKFTTKPYGKLWFDRYEDLSEEQFQEVCNKIELINQR